MHADVAVLSPDGARWAVEAKDLQRFTSRGSDSNTRGSSSNEESVKKTFSQDLLDLQHVPHPREIPPWPSLMVLPHLTPLHHDKSLGSGQASAVEACLQHPSQSQKALLNWNQYDGGEQVFDPTVQFADEPEIVKLEEHVPPGLLPEVLFVTDPEGKTVFLPEYSSSSNMKVYKRTFPRLGENAIHSDIHGTIYATRRPQTAHLDLSFAKDLGADAGSHSKVLLGKLRLPEPLVARSSTGQFEVAVKLTRSDQESHRMLRTEAKLYDTAIPQYLTGDWSGFHFIEDAVYDGDGIVPVAAVVPKFYGFYIPVHGDHIGLLSPILLMEECGTPIDVKRLTPKDRELIYSFAIRIHRCGVSQGSFFDRNVLVQPGPLSIPPSLRSTSTPSFRVIDFGRGERRGDMTKREWKAICKDEMVDVKEAIYGGLKRINKHAPRGSGKQIAFARKYWSTRKPTYG